MSSRSGSYARRRPWLPVAMYLSAGVRWAIHWWPVPVSRYQTSLLSTKPTPKPSPQPASSMMRPRSAHASRAVVQRESRTSGMSSSVMPEALLYGSIASASSRAKMDSVPVRPTPSSLKPTAPWNWVCQFGTVVKRMLRAGWGHSKAVAPLWSCVRYIEPSGHSRAS